MSDKFWKDLVDVLRIAMPVIKLVRLLDSNKPIMGKIHQRMFHMGETLARMKDKVPWYAEMVPSHANRWEYLHSPMHAAAYALDPASAARRPPSQPRLPAQPWLLLGLGE